MRYVTFFSSLFFSAGLLAQSAPNALDTLDHLLRFEFAGKPFAICRTKDVTGYFKDIGSIRTSWFDQQRMLGKATVAATSDFQPRNDLFKLNAAVEMSRGTFPSQFRVRAAVGITLGNGVFQENISELNIAYDYHHRYTQQVADINEEQCLMPDQERRKQQAAKDSVVIAAIITGMKSRRGVPATETDDIKEARKRAHMTAQAAQRFERLLYEEVFHKLHDPLRWENYVYMSRFSDNFMRLDQRYEVGLGTIIAHWSRSVTSSGDAAYTRFRRLRYGACGDAPSCIDTVCSATGNSSLSPAGKAEVARANHRAWGSSRKTTTVWRYGLLGGLTAEVEKHAVAFDSLWTDHQLVRYEIPGQSSMRLRYTLRPFVEFRPTDRFSLSYRPYFYLPAPWEWHSSVAYSDLQGEQFLDERVDWRLDSQFKVEIKLTPASDASNKEVTVGISYRSWYDNAPNRMAVDSFKDGLQQLVVAPSVHNQILFALGVAF